ncbi:MAG: hypothetical protein ABI134_12675, partial [Byssovorax sp.]
MRSTRWSMAASGLAVFGALGWVMGGCSASAQEDLTDPQLGRTDRECLGDLVEPLSSADKERLIRDECGVFAQADAAGDGGGDGTQAAPYKSLQSAINAAQKSRKRVYACSNATTPFKEAVTVSAPVEVYGGFECGVGWVWNTSTRSLITGDTQQVSLTLTSSAGGARIEGFKITSASATVKGTSSVAVAVDDITAALVGCD